MAITKTSSKMLNRNGREIRAPQGVDSAVVCDREKPIGTPPARRLEIDLGVPWFWMPACADEDRERRVRSQTMPIHPRTD